MEHRDLWTLDALIEAYKQHQRRTPLPPINMSKLTSP